MKIARVLNNNTVLAMDGEKQMLVMGLSIGYRKKPGMRLEEEKIEHKFILSDISGKTGIEQLYMTIPEEYLVFTGKLLEKNGDKVHCNFSGNFLIHLADHIYSVVQRCREGLTLNNVLLLDVAQYYPAEYGIALSMVEDINEEFHVTLGVDEAGFITFHLLEAELELQNALTEIKQITEILNQALRIVREYFHLEFRRQSAVYSRFLIHLKFLAQRVVQGTHLCDSVDEELICMLRHKYPRESDCAEQVMEYIHNQFDFNPSGFEIMYLTIHIVRVTKEV